MGKLSKKTPKSPAQASSGRSKRNHDKTGHTSVSAPKKASNRLKMALGRKKPPLSSEDTTKIQAPEPPKLVSRRENRASSFKMGRTIGEKRERLETANERATARKKDKKRQVFRVFFTVTGFAALIIILIIIFLLSVRSREPDPIPIEEPVLLQPTIPIIDEEATAAGGRVTSRMTAYVATAEQDFRDLGYVPVKVVIPSGAIREVDFYLEGHPGYIKMTIDRDSAVSVEDADRLYRYLASIDVSNFAYIDVRIDGKAYYRPLDPAEPPAESSTEPSSPDASLSEE